MNWHERIDLAEKRGSFTEADRELAKDWVTCACGEQDPRIRRDEIGAPLDRDLGLWGRFFFLHVNNNQLGEARIALQMIEARAKEILEKQKLKKHGKITIRKGS